MHHMLTRVHNAFHHRVHRLLTYAFANLVVEYMYQFTFFQEQVSKSTSRALGIIPYIFMSEIDPDGKLHAHVLANEVVHTIALFVLCVVVAHDWRNPRPDTGAVSSRHAHKGSSRDSLASDEVPLTHASRHTYESDMPGVDADSMSSDIDAETSMMRSARRSGAVRRAVIKFSARVMYVGCLALMVVWALAFPTWPSLAVLVWAFYLLLRSRKTYYAHAPFVLGYLGLLVISVFFRAMFGAVSKTGNSDWGIPAESDNPGYLCLKLLAQSTIFAVIAFSVRVNLQYHAMRSGSSGPGSERHQGVTAASASPGVASINVRSGTAHQGNIKAAGEDQGGKFHGEKSSGTIATDGTVDGIIVAPSPDRAHTKSPLPFAVGTSRLVKVAQRAVRIAVDYTYFVTMLIIFLAALDSVSILNAIYLFLITVYIMFPQFIRSGWIVLVVYAEASIAVVFLWGFSPFQNVLSDSHQRLLGVSTTSHDDVWNTLRYDIAILCLALVQLYSMSFFNTHNMKPDATGETSLLNNKYFCRIWHVVTLGAFLFYGIIGRPTVLKLGYLVNFFLPLTLFQFSMTTLSRWVSLIGVLYSGLVLYLMYIYQFTSLQEQVSSFCTRIGVSNMADIGLVEQQGEHQQRDLFLYLLPPVVVFAISVVRTRLSDGPRKFTPRTDAIATAKVSRFEALLIYVGRLFWLESDKMVVLSAFASTVFGCTGLLAAPTIVLVVLVSGTTWVW